MMLQTLEETRNDNIPRLRGRSNKARCAPGGAGKKESEAQQAPRATGSLSTTKGKNKQGRERFE